LFKPVSNHALEVLSGKSLLEAEKIKVYEYCISGRHLCYAAVLYNAPGYKASAGSYIF
jgi:hypothetical protein